MPLTVITLKNSPPSLRGDLTKWMQEISTGVYVGNFNTKVREELWKRVVDSIGLGEATMTFSYRNEIGYNFETHNSDRTTIDYDGIPLVLMPTKKEEEDSEKKHGFSKAAKIRKAKIFGGAKKKDAIQNFVVIDTETTGLDYLNDRIIEIGAVKKTDGTQRYSCVIKYDGNLNETIKNLTGINEDDLKNGKEEKEAVEELLKFIGDYPIIGYNIDFDIKFLNQALQRNGFAPIKNKTYNLMKYVKQEKLFLENYKLQTVIKEYGIDEKVPHRALGDAEICLRLLEKVKKLRDLLK